MSVLEEFFVDKTDLFEYQEGLELYLMALPHNSFAQTLFGCCERGRF